MAAPAKLLVGKIEGVGVSRGNAAGGCLSNGDHMRCLAEAAEKLRLGEFASQIDTLDWDLVRDEFAPLLSE